MYVESRNQNIVNQAINSQLNSANAVGSANYNNLRLVDGNSIDQLHSSLTQPSQDLSSTSSQSNSQSKPNSLLLFQAYEIFNSDLSDEKKFLKLAKIGISTDFATDALNGANGASNNGPNGQALLNITQTAANWSDLSDEQRVVNVAEIISSASSNGARGVAGGVASIITGGYQVIQGVQQADDIIDYVEDLPRSQAFKPGVAGLAMTGFNIGLGVAGVATGVGLVTGSVLTGTALSSFITAGASFGPIGLALGLVAGIAVAFTGSGKSTGQSLRDGWRDGLEQQGFAQVINGSHHVTLADGSLYDIGVDGSNKLANVGVNVDGNTERNTFDVDFTNEVTVASIPEGHVYAIATGLDPTSNEGHGLFERAMAQGLNAATSNATSVEEVRANYRAMLGDAPVESIAIRIEALRVTNKITEQEYGVYLHHLNKIYGTEIAPSDIGQAKEFFAAQLSQNPQEQWSASEQDFFLQLTDPVKIQEAQEQLERRVSASLAN